MPLILAALLQLLNTSFHKYACEQLALLPGDISNRHSCPQSRGLRLWGPHTCLRHCPGRPMGMEGTCCPAASPPTSHSTPALPVTALLVLPSSRDVGPGWLCGSGGTACRGLGQEEAHERQGWMRSSACQVPAYVCPLSSRGDWGYQWAWQDLTLTLSLSTPPYTLHGLPTPVPATRRSWASPFAGQYPLCSPKGQEWSLPWGKSGVPCAPMLLGVPGFRMCEGAFQSLWDSVQRLVLRESPTRVPGVCPLPRSNGNHGVQVAPSALGRGWAGFSHPPLVCKEEYWLLTILDISPRLTPAA